MQQTIDTGGPRKLCSNCAHKWRGGCLALGMVGLGFLSVWVHWLSYHNGHFELNESDWHVGDLPTAAVLAAGLASALGVLTLIWTLCTDRTVRSALNWIGHWLNAHRWWALAIGAAVLLGAADIYQLFYDPYAKQRGFYTYVLRDDLQNWLLLAATLCGGLSLLSFSPLPLREGRVRASVPSGFSSPPGPSSLLTHDRGYPSPLTPIQRFARSLELKPKRWWALAMLLPAFLGAALSFGSLEGLPHFSDSLTYLMQGRVLYTGSLSLPKPATPELWIGSLFFVTDGQHIDPATNQMVYEGTRFFGKYPIGWPAIVGTFDAAGVGFAANATLMGLGALLTGLIARRFATQRVAILAALAFGLSPWVWFNGADFASHGASMVALMAFIWMTLQMLDAQALTSARWRWALGAGLALGAGILIRPGDATNFALPIAIWMAWLILRQPKRWILPGAVMIAGLSVGAGLYLWCNAHTTGHALKSPYALESRWADDWHPTLGSMLARFAFQWQQLNSRFPGWGIGGLTMAVIGLAVVSQRRKVEAQVILPRADQGATQRPHLGAVCLPPGSGTLPGAGVGTLPGGLWLLLAGTGVFFIFNTAFGFTNVWWGPRWLLPAVPAVAILSAFVLDELIKGSEAFSVPSGTTPGNTPGIDPQTSPNLPETSRIHPEFSQSTSENSQIAPKISQFLPKTSQNLPEISQSFPHTFPVESLLMSMILAGLLVGLSFRYGGQWWANRLYPPHFVSGLVPREVQKRGIQQAVVALPANLPMNLADKMGKCWLPLDARAGIVTMCPPWDSNPVIYVRQIPGWVELARQMYPGREIWEVEPGPTDRYRFDIKRLE